MQSRDTPEPPRSAPPTPVTDADMHLPEMEEEARRELGPDYERVHARSEVEGERQGLRLTYRSVLLFVAAAVVIVALLFDWRAGLVAALLCVGFSMPFLVAGVWTRNADARAATLDDAVRHKHERRVHG